VKVSDDLVPFGTEQAKAVQEGSKAVGKAIDLTDKVVGFVGRVLGGPIENAVGLVGGDWLQHARLRNADRLAARTEALLAQRQIKKPEPVSAVLAVPLLRAAQDESREEVQELWARLLANAMDPKRAHTVRQSFIDILRRLDPLDALTLQKMFRDNVGINSSGLMNHNIRLADFARVLGVGSDELVVSLDNLVELRCVELVNDQRELTPTGRCFMAAVQE
jgi:hypothetical protein